MLSCPQPTTRLWRRRQSPYTERRVMEVPDDLPEGPYRIGVGVYNRVSGERLPVALPDGSAVADNVFSLGANP